MATFILLPVSKSIIIILLTSLLAVNSITATFYNDDYIKTIDPKLLGLKKEKLTHFQVYWQDILSGPNPTSVQIVKPPSKTGFGLVQMIDNALTSKPGLSSKLVGRAQGFYAVAAQGDFAFLMVMNFAFIEGKYNGSTITVLGRNHVLSKVREMSVVGGSGLFRFARGYVEARTKMFNFTNGDATVEYTCYVLHY